MLERYYVRPKTVDQIRSSWIGGAIEKYVEWLSPLCQESCRIAGAG